MAHVAKEMERLGIKLPLLIGGATTSLAHTAVKIEPNYSGTTVYVKDASRAVGVCTQLLSPELRDAYMAEVKADYIRIRESHKGKRAQSKRATLAQARANALVTDWGAYTPTGSQTTEPAGI